MRIFELDDRPVASFDVNNAVVFDSGAWRPASLWTARSALLNGTELTITQFKAAFPLAAMSFSKLDFQGPAETPN